MLSYRLTSGFGEMGEKVMDANVRKISTYGTVGNEGP